MVSDTGERASGALIPSPSLSRVHSGAAHWCSAGLQLLPSKLTPLSFPSPFLFIPSVCCSALLCCCCGCGGYPSQRLYQPTAGSTEQSSSASGIRGDGTGEGWVRYNALRWVFPLRHRLLSRTAAALPLCASQTPLSVSPRHTRGSSRSRKETLTNDHAKCIPVFPSRLIQCVCEEVAAVSPLANLMLTGRQHF